MRAAALLALVLLVPGAASADLIFGPTARSAFESFVTDFGDTFIDFEGVVNGPLTTELQVLGVTFGTIADASLGPVDFPVVVLPFAFVQSDPDNNRIIGARTAAPNSLPDGQFAYEIVFETPQQRAGLQRNWNTLTLTRFFNASGLLEEHQNTVANEFVGFIVASSDSADWITRIEINGLVSEDLIRHVGQSDDLFLGSVIIPEPSTWALLVAGLALLVVMRRRLA